MRQNLTDGASSAEEAILEQKDKLVLLTLTP